MLLAQPKVALVIIDPRRSYQLLIKGRQAHALCRQRPAKSPPHLVMYLTASSKQYKGLDILPVDCYLDLLVASFAIHPD